jgi:hypothetical protein
MKTKILGTTLMVLTGLVYAQQKPLVQLSDTPAYQQMLLDSQKRAEAEEQRRKERLMQQQIQQLQQQQQQLRQQLQK